MKKVGKIFLSFFFLCYGRIADAQVPVSVRPTSCGLRGGECGGDTPWKTVGAAVVCLAGKEIDR